MVTLVLRECDQSVWARPVTRPIIDVKESLLITTHDYNVTVTGTGAKSGILRAPADGLPEMTVASPPQFGGPEHLWSPEHLFVAAVASCLMTTFRSIADHSGVEVLGYSDQSTGRLQRGEDGLYSIDRITLRPTVVISEGSAPERTRRLLEKAEKVCLIGRSVHSETTLEPTILVRHQVGT